MSFVNLRVRSSFSLGESALSCESVAKAAADLGQSAATVADAAVLSGLVLFSKACKAFHVRPVLGASLWTDDYELQFLVKNQTGYKNLCWLITKAVTRLRYVPRTTLEEIVAHHEGLVCMTMDRTGPTRLDEAQALEVVGRLEQAFRNDLYLEIADQGLPGQGEALACSRALSRRLGVSLIATSEARYLRPEDAVAFRTIRCTAMGWNVDSKQAEACADLDTDQLFFRSEAEMAEIFPDDMEAIARTVEVAEKCEYSPYTKKFFFPQSEPVGQTAADRWRWLQGFFPTPKAFEARGTDLVQPQDKEGWSDTDLYFTAFARAGLAIRFDEERQAGLPLDESEYWKRLELEISMIQKMRFPGYMLIVSEFVNWARDHDVPVGPGRGSVAGSIVAWAMRVTEVDSIRYGLFFERFLNPDRISMPDVDTDFGNAKRERVITHMREKYGADSVGQIANYLTLGPRSALKDACRALGVYFNDSNTWSGLIGAQATSIGSAVATSKELTALYTGNPVFHRAAILAAQVDGLARGYGLHAAGCVVTPGPMSNFAPVGEGGVLALDMKAVETLGLVKFDFLGLRTLDVIEEALDSVEKNTGSRPDIRRLALSDPETCRLLSKDDTIGVFQVESSGMQSLFRRFGPESVDDVCALLALYRPGPLQSGMVDDYVDRKQGKEPVSYPHPRLEKILEATYGVMVYQEQILLIARELSGYSLSEADMLRRAIGKKLADEMAAQKTRFISGAAERGVDPRESEKIFDVIQGFAEYCFNKAHSLAYALLTCQTAWLKARYPAEFLAASMTWEMKDEDRLFAFLGDCRRRGLPIRPPDINESVSGFTADGHGIRYAIGAIKKVGDAAVSAIAAERAKGPFLDISDFVHRIDRKAVGAAALERLCKSGAFDTLGVRREDALQLLLSIKGKKTPQRELLTSSSPRWTWSERMEAEEDALGLWLSGHPLSAYGVLPARRRTHKIVDLPACDAKAPVTLVGVVRSLKKIQKRGGRPIAWIELSDETGSVEVTCFSDVIERWETIMTKGRTLIVQGTRDKAGPDGQVKVDTLEALDDYRHKNAATVRIRLLIDEVGEDASSEAFAAILKEHPGVCPVLVVVEDPAHQWRTTLQPADGIDPTPELFMAVERFTGRADATSVAC